MSDLKRLGFVHSYGNAGIEAVAQSKTYATAKGLYASTKEHSVLKPGLKVLEGYLAPMATRVVEVAPSALKQLDSKVDASLAYATTVYETQVLPSAPMAAALQLKHALSATHEANAAAFLQARTEYFALIEAHIESLKARGVSLSSDALAAVSSSIADARLRATSEAHAALEKVSAAWDSFLATPSVAHALEAATPAVSAAKERALQASRYIASSPHYKAYLEPSVNKLAQQPRVAAALERLRPLVAAF